MECRGTRAAQPNQPTRGRQIRMNVIVRNVRLIDGTGAGPFPRVTVDVRNGLIRSVGEGSRGPRSHVAGEDIRASI